MNRIPQIFLFLAAVAVAGTRPLGSLYAAEAASRPATAPSPQADVASLEAADSTTFPALTQLNRECQALYRRLDGCVLQVQMPTPRWMLEAEQESPLNRYKLNEDPADARATVAKFSSGTWAK